MKYDHSDDLMDNGTTIFHPFRVLLSIKDILHSYSSRLPCYVFCICMLTNIRNTVELGDQLHGYMHHGYMHHRFMYHSCRGGK